MNEWFWAAYCSSRLARLAICLALVCAAFYRPVSAEDAEGSDNGDMESDILTLPALDIAAPPIVRTSDVNRYGMRLDTVGSEQIDKSNVQDLAEALKRIPGVTISRFNMVGSYGGGEGGGVFIRGHGAGRPGGEISTQIDGIPRFNGIWTHPLLDTLSIDVADKIVVRKSPEPVTGGNMAFASVNMVSKRARREESETALEAAAGSHNTYMGKFEHGGKSGKLDYYLAGSHRESDGHRDDSAGETNNLYGHFGYQPDAHWDVSLLVNHTDSWAEDPRAEDEAPLIRTEKYNTDAQFYLLTLAHDYEEFSGYTKFYYEDGWAKWEQVDQDVDPDEPFDHYPIWDNYGVHVREDLALFPDNTLTLGADWDVVTAKSKDVYPGGRVEDRLDRRSFQKVSPYMKMAHTFDVLADEVELTPSAGIRWTDSRYFDDEFSYEAGVVAEYGQTKVYANYARPVNYPGIYTAMFYENFWSGAPGNDPDGWKELDSEKMDHYEIGCEHGFSDALKVNVSLYHDKVRNRLLITAPPPAFRNVGDYTSKGVEAMLSLFPRDDIDVFLGGSYNDTSPADIPQTPEWKGSAGIEYRVTDRLTVNLDGEYVDSRFVVNTRNAAEPQEKVGDYFVANARVGYKFYTGEAGRQLEVYLAGKNLTDTDYEYQPGYPMPGATIMGGMSLTF